MVHQYDDFTQKQLIKNAILILEHLAKKYPKDRYLKILFYLIVEMMVREVNGMALKD